LVQEIQDAHNRKIMIEEAKNKGPLGVRVDGASFYQDINARKNGWQNFSKNAFFYGTVL